MNKITDIETLLVQLPTRREHRWTGLTEPIGRYELPNGPGMSIEVDLSKVAQYRIQGVNA